MILIGLVGLAAFSSGCASYFTSIEKVDEGTYLVTETRAGFLSAKGRLLLCKGKGQTLSCQVIDTQ